MFLWDALKGAIRKMLSPNTVEQVLHIQPSISTVMRDSIDLWSNMYQDKSPWLVTDTGVDKIELKSLNIPAVIASEKARTATIEMKVKVTGDGERAEFMKKTFKQVTDTIRKNLEYGIALGGIVIKPYVMKDIDDKWAIKFSYVKATDFYPMVFSSDGSLREAAFVERITEKFYIYTKVEYHKLDGATLTVTNTAYRLPKNQYVSQMVSNTQTDLGEPIQLTEVPEWANLEPTVTIANMNVLLFSYFKMPEANTVDIDSPLGVSGYSRAVNLIRNADEQYSNLLWEFEGGQLAVDVDRTAFNPIIDKDGHVKQELPKYQNRLFRHNLDLGEDDTYHVFNPNFRDVSLINGLNNILMHIEDVCFLSRGTLSQVTMSEARTATELKILKQRSFSANQDIQLELQRVFEELFVIMDKYCDLYNIVPAGDFQVAYAWDDSILVDKDTERQGDLLDIDKGLMSKVEYRMKWYGETEEQAKEMIDKIGEEQSEAMIRQQEIMIQTQGQIAGQNDDGNSDDTRNAKNEGEKEETKEDENEKRKRANESGKKTKQE